MTVGRYPLQSCEKNISSLFLTQLLAFSIFSHISHGWKFLWPWDEDSESLAVRLQDQTQTRLAIQALTTKKIMMQLPWFDSCSPLAVFVSQNVFCV